MYSPSLANRQRKIERDLSDQIANQISTLHDMVVTFNICPPVSLYPDERSNTRIDCGEAKRTALYPIATANKPSGPFPECLFVIDVRLEPHDLVAMVAVVHG